MDRNGTLMRTVGPPESPIVRFRSDAKIKKSAAGCKISGIGAVSEVGVVDVADQVGLRLGGGAACGDE